MSKPQIIKQVDAIEDRGEVVLHVNMDDLRESSSSWGGHTLVRVLLDGKDGSTNVWLSFVERRAGLEAVLTAYDPRKFVEKTILLRKSSFFKRAR